MFFHSNAAQMTNANNFKLAAKKHVSQMQAQFVTQIIIIADVLSLSRSVLLVYVIQLHLLVILELAQLAENV